MGVAIGGNGATVAGSGAAVEVGGTRVVVAVVLWMRGAVGDGPGIGVAVGVCAGEATGVGSKSGSTAGPLEFDPGPVVAETGVARDANFAG